MSLISLHPGQVSHDIQLPSFFPNPPPKKNLEFLPAHLEIPSSLLISNDLSKRFPAQREPGCLIETRSSHSCWFDLLPLKKKIKKQSLRTKTPHPLIKIERNHFPWRLPEDLFTCWCCSKREKWNPPALIYISSLYPAEDIKRFCTLLHPPFPGWRIKLPGLRSGCFYSFPSPPTSDRCVQHGELRWFACWL